jgi:hypothetical protein
MSIDTLVIFAHYDNSKLASPMPIRVLILVCALRTQPSACTTETAIDVTQGPRAHSELMCGKLGQGVLAGTAIAPQAGLEYVKITCLRERLTP